MAETVTGPKGSGQEGAAASPQRPEADSEPWGGEVRVRSGAAPSLLRWLNYGLFVWAIIYLLVHPRLGQGQVFLWIAAVLLTGWALLRFVTKKPPEI